MDELPLNDARKPAPKKGSLAYVRRELRRFRELSRDHDGLTQVGVAKLILGVSDQRVRQLIQAGRIRSFDILGKVYVSCADLEEFAKLERPIGVPVRLQTAA